MKRLVLLLTVIALLPLTSIFSQPDESYILEHRSDTLVVKDDFDFSGPNTLYLLLQTDTTNTTYTVPAGRVYMLHKDGYYSLANGITSANDRRVVIIGEDESFVKGNQSVDFPPVVSQAIVNGAGTGGGMTSGNDLVVKNINIELGSPGHASEMWNWFGNAANARITLDNCIMEHTFWVMMNPGSNAKVYILNSYFVNMSGQACRRNGGVIDYFSDLDTVMVENCTHLIGQGSVYKFRASRTKEAIFNHNTFVDLAGYVFMNEGYQTRMAVTNNIFVNCNVQGWSGQLAFDPGENDPAAMPMGIVNVSDPDTIHVAADSIHFYVDKNLVYWDPSLTDVSTGVIATINAGSVSGISTWASQMITMNSRTQAMFDDNNTYPYLTEGTWVRDQIPTFTNPQDLFSTQLTNIKQYAIDKADTGSTVVLTDWRLVNTGADYYTYADWPIPVDLSYSDADLKTAGLDGLPLGDLNWFPTEYQTWWAQRDAEYVTINAALDGVVGVAEPPAAASKFALAQNYPNPFNPSTVISYSIPKASNVTLKVYDVLGNEVATLVNQFQNANSYKVNFNAASLASGVYIYKIEAGNFTMSKKMLLLK